MQSSENKYEEDVMRKRIAAAGLLVLCILSVLAGFGGQTVYADTTGSLSGEVTMLKAEEDNYVLQVSVENQGKDFDGSVRVELNASTDQSCVFDTEISLPAQGKKQYTLTIPELTVGGTRGTGKLSFLNKKGKVIQSENFRNIFEGKVKGFQVGIYSDAYDKLSYLDMDGENYIIGDAEKPISLVELNEKNIVSELDGLYFLVMDQCDTSLLDKEIIQAIQNWVDQGGFLIIGTGQAGEATVKGFDEDFINLQVGEISEKGEENSISQRMNQNGDYYNLKDSGIDPEQLCVAEIFVDWPNGYESSNFPGYVTSYGQGSIGVAKILFCEDEMQKANAEFCRCLYDEVMYASSSSGNYAVSAEYAYLYPNAFATIDREHTDVNFKWLKILTLVYVVLVGPVLYVVLKHMKKREGYWFGVPILGILFVGAVFIIGQTQNVHGIRMYSVTSEPAEGKVGEKIHTYYSGYRSGVKAWAAELKDNYDCAGSAFEEYGTSATSLRPGDYHYRVNYGSGIQIGMKPQKSFETGYMCAQGTGSEEGSIVTENLTLMINKQEGSVTNRTEHDLPYMMLASDEYLMLIKDVKAQETIDISKIKKSSRVVYEQPTDYLDECYYTVTGAYDNRQTDTEDKDLRAAVFIGLLDAKKESAQGENDIVVSAVISDSEKTLKGKCSEIAYRCLYTIAKQEVTNAAD